MPDIAWGSYTMLATGSLIGLFAAYRILLQGFSLLFWVLLLTGGAITFGLGAQSLGEDNFLSEYLPIAALENLKGKDFTEQLQSLPQEARSQIRALCEQL
jgi:hypothetical protein